MYLWIWKKSAKDVNWKKEYFGQSNNYRKILLTSYMLTAEAYVDDVNPKGGRLHLEALQMTLKTDVSSVRYFLKAIEAFQCSICRYFAEIWICH